MEKNNEKEKIDVILNSHEMDYNNFLKFRIVSKKKGRKINLM